MGEVIVRHPVDDEELWALVDGEAAVDSPEYEAAVDELLERYVDYFRRVDELERSVARALRTDDSVRGCRRLAGIGAGSDDHYYPTAERRRDRIVVG